MKRETRNLIHEKGGRIREVDYLPIKSDGQDGDARMFNEDLFIKTKGNWVKIMSGDKIINQELTRNINNIVSEGVLQHTSLTGVTANQHHNQVHSIDGSDHTGTLTVAKGGTGVGTLTDGGVLLGSGTGAITALAVLTDGQMIVGDGSTDPVAESGATLRTSIGVGTGDSPTFTALTLTSNITMGDDTSIGIADDAERIEFDGAGDISFLGCNVGIGDSAPGAKLEIRAAATTASTPLEVLRLTVADDDSVELAAGHGPSIDFYVPDGTSARVGGRIAVVKENSNDDSNESQISF